MDNKRYKKVGYAVDKEIVEKFEEVFEQHKSVFKTKSYLLELLMSQFIEKYNSINDNKEKQLKALEEMLSARQKLLIQGKKTLSHHIEEEKKHAII